MEMGCPVEESRPFENEMCPTHKGGLLWEVLEHVHAISRSGTRNVCNDGADPRPSQHILCEILPVQGSTRPALHCQCWKNAEYKLINCSFTRLLVAVSAARDDLRELPNPSTRARRGTSVAMLGRS